VPRSASSLRARIARHYRRLLMASGRLPRRVVFFRHTPGRPRPFIMAFFRVEPGERVAVTVTAIRRIAIY